MWLLPPVVGEINNGYAVILYEFKNKQSSHQVYFQSTDHEVIHFLTPNLEGPSRLEIPLLPNRQYTAIWDLTYTHIVNTNIPSKFIFLSCDLPEADINPSLWERISQSILEEPSLIVHLGDQIYGDLQFKKVKESLRKEYKSADLLFEIYRKRYRQTWFRLAPVLSNSSNIMIWDDHEITNDFSFSNPKNYLEESAGNIAFEIYKEYQKSLNLDLSDKSINWVKLYGDTVIISMERTLYSPSLDELRNKLSRYPDITKFILASAGSILPGDGSKFFPSSFIIELYSIVFEWLKENSIRKALLIGGDLHLGCLAQITNGTNSFYVASASPISNQPTLDRFFLANELSQSRQINTDIIYNPIEARACRCYLQVHEEDLVPSMIWADQHLTSSPFKYAKTLFSFA